MPRLTSLSGKLLSPLGTARILLRILQNPNAYDTPDFDQFGRAVSIDGNNAIVGAFREDDANFIGVGKAYIFNVSTGTLVHTLSNPRSSALNGYNDNFGWSVDIAGNYAIVGVYDSNSAYIFNVTTGALVHTLSNPNPNTGSADDEFGYAVGISGNYAIVGAYTEDDIGESANNNNGKAYIYNVTTGALVHTLDNPVNSVQFSSNTNDFFGSAVGISGNYAIVGAYNEDAFGSSLMSNSGKAYIYNVTTGALVHALDNPNAGSQGSMASDVFGFSVAIDGNYAIVGAYGEDDNYLSSGKAYIFNVTTGALLHTLDNPNPYNTSQNDQIAKKVDISGNYAIVNAEGEDDAGGSGSGKAYIFNVNTGQLLKTLDNPNVSGTSASDSFSIDVGISGNYVIAGASGEDLGGDSAGTSYIYDITGLLRILNNYWQGGITETLLEEDDPSTGQSDDFGQGVAIAADGEYAVVGTPGDNGNSAISGGSISIFNKSGGIWSRQATKFMTSRSNADYFGTAVSIDGEGNRIIASGWGDDITEVGSGSVTVFSRSGSTWTNEAVLVADDPQSLGGFGFPSIDLNSDDGSYAIIGQQGWDTGGSTQVGKVYIFNRSGSNWSLQQSFNSEPRASGYFGSAVSVNPDATYLFVGAQGAGGGVGQVTSSGLGFIWTRSGSTWTQQDYFTPNDPESGCGFGYSGSINDDGTYVAIGAPFKNNSDSGQSSGAVYIFTRSGSTWSQQAKILKSSSLRLGHTVSINSDATVLAISDVSTASSVRGQVHMYQREGTSWSFIRSLTQTVNEPDSDITANQFGISFELDSLGKQLIVGAPTTDYPALGQNNVGAAYIIES